MSRVTRTGCGRRRVGDGHQEPVAAPGKRLDELRGIRGVAKHLANLPDAEIQPLIEVHERVAAPDVIADLDARHDLAAAAGEEFEDLERLRRQLEHVAALPQFAGCRVQLERGEPQDRVAHSSKTHRELIPHPWKGCRKGSTIAPV